MKTNNLPRSTKYPLFAFLLFAFLFILQIPSAKAQICYGSYTLNSQAAVDAFSCTQVTGELTISGNDITNLDALSSLTGVNQAVWIIKNDSLTQIDGLSNLSSLGGSLTIDGNPSLTNVRTFVRWRCN